jgi:multiple sugar transport system permease protein
MTFQQAEPQSSGKIARMAGRPRDWNLMLSGLVAQTVLVAMAVAVLVPLVWMVLGSFKTYPDLLNNPNQLPQPWILTNYVEIFNIGRFDLAFMNSVIVSALRTLSACLTSVVLGYVFAKYTFPGKNVIFILILATMMIPFPSIIISLYLKLSDLQLLDQLSGVVIVSLFYTFGVLLLRQWISGIPNAFIDAARIDGAGELRIIFSIIVPMSAPPLAALAVFVFLGSWDDYLFPSLVLTSPEVKTLPLALAGLKSLYWDRYELYCAGAMVTVVPVMLLYASMQKQFVRGFTLMGGVKE